MNSLPAPFQPTIGLVIWTWVVFIMLFLLLRKYVFPPLVQMTEEREALIKKNLDDAERLRSESAAALEDQR
ncbi:MAG: ATP synthase F0 subunit B, partial [Gemmatimonadales bacterium]